MFRTISLAAITLFALAAPSFAHEQAFTARLDGATQPTVTGSAATGEATLRVDPHTQTVDIEMRVHGLFLDDLADHIIHTGRGPVHLHLYAASGDISLLVPFPYGAAYTDTADGFALRIDDYSYAEGAALLNSQMTFAEFLSTLDTEFVYLNIHTDRVPDGEISGRLVRG